MDTMGKVLPLREVNPTDEVPETDWLIPDVVARGKVTMLAGVGGGGKSLLALQYANRASERMRVVVVDAENGEEIIRQRMASLPEVHPMGQSNPRVFEARGFDLENHGEIEYLESILAAGCDLLVLDSWISLGKKSKERSETAAKESIGAIRSLAQRFQVGVLLLCHTDKAGTTLRGSGAAMNEAEALFLFKRGDNAKQRQLICQKMRFAEEPEPKTLEFLPEGGFRLVFPVTAQLAPAKATRAPRVAVKRPPTVREILAMEKRGLVSKKEAQSLLYQHHQVGDGGRRWWRLGR